MKCTFCEYEGRPDNVKRHVKTTHEKVISYSCDCAKSFTSTTALKRHKLFSCRLGENRTARNRPIESPINIQLDQIKDAQVLITTTDGEVHPIDVALNKIHRILSIATEVDDEPNLNESAVATESEPLLALTPAPSPMENATFEFSCEYNLCAVHFLVIDNSHSSSFSDEEFFPNPMDEQLASIDTLDDNIGAEETINELEVASTAVDPWKTANN